VYIPRAFFGGQSWLKSAKCCKKAAVGLKLKACHVTSKESKALVAINPGGGVLFTDLCKVILYHRFESDPSFTKTRQQIIILLNQ
jgi:hypothetical protein